MFNRKRSFGKRLQKRLSLLFDQIYSKQFEEIGLTGSNVWTIII